MFKKIDANQVKKVLFSFVSGTFLGAGGLCSVLEFGNIFFNRNFGVGLGMGGLALAATVVGGISMKKANDIHKLQLAQNPEIAQQKPKSFRLFKETAFVRADTASNSQPAGQETADNTVQQNCSDSVTEILPENENSDYRNSGFFKNYFHTNKQPQQFFHAEKMTVNMVNVSVKGNNKPAKTETKTGTDIDNIIEKVKHFTDKYNVMREDTADFVKLHILYPNGRRCGTVILYKDCSKADYCDMSDGSTVIKKDFNLDDLKYYL